MQVRQMIDRAFERRQSERSILFLNYWTGSGRRQNLAHLVPLIAIHHASKHARFAATEL